MQYLNVESQQKEHENNMSNIFKVNNKDTRMTSGASIAILNIFCTVFY